ncbi:formylmethanofuran dehydrogenase [Methanobrevibacter sp. TMH8]|uniref:FmdE family protein n=1 Tax=Methanobrevibacter sp. TMH8 TaxID=2848611 RepID=UPI001CCEB555|nr:FmdE family protein [Methanobrevibacter sp. TMH8]MBZ9570752.1 formylmethanofuran dehydrogenase [Methanobrevibacter sp. TMH8]
MIKTFDEVTEFHGHVCPGSAIGYKAAKIAVEELNIDPSEDEEILAIVENDSCAVDSIQVVLSCTFGKGNLIFNDYGKGVYTIIARDKDKAIRLAMKNSFNPMKINPKFGELKEKERNNTISSQEKEQLKIITKEVCDYIINMPNEEIFSIKEVEIAPIEKANIYKSIICDNCGELTAEHRIKEYKDKNEYKDKKLCIPCYEEELKNK